jgi:hypothetical protein
MNWLTKLFNRNQNKGKNSYTIRQGKITQADKVFDAWTSGNLEEMLEATKFKTNPIDRHFLLLKIVEETYKQRKDKTQREIFKKYAQQHLDEFPNLSNSLKKEFDNKLPRVPTFQKYSTVLAEEFEFEKAINVCKMAIDYNLDDGTISGFQGRIKRIKKKKRPSA